MRRRTQLVVLCEDALQERFFRRLCGELRFLRQVRFVLAPPGAGSAEQWVRSRYPLEMRAYRRQANHLTNGLLVSVDGDRLGVDARKSQLDSALAEDGQDVRRPDDRVAIFVPTWSIETWLLWLCGIEPIDEHTPYKRDPSYQRRKEAREVGPVQAAEAWFTSSQRPSAPASLVDGRTEMERLRAEGQGARS
jgi:hypothetical protein